MRPLRIGDTQIVAAREGAEHHPIDAVACGLDPRLAVCRRFNLLLQVRRHRDLTILITNLRLPRFLRDHLRAPFKVHAIAEVAESVVRRDLHCTRHTLGHARGRHIMKMRGAEAKARLALALLPPLVLLLRADALTLERRLDGARIDDVPRELTARAHCRLYRRGCNNQRQPVLAATLAHHPLVA